MRCGALTVHLFAHSAAAGLLLHIRSPQSGTSVSNDSSSAQLPTTTPSTALGGTSSLLTQSATLSKPKEGIQSSSFPSVVSTSSLSSSASTSQSSFASSFVFDPLPTQEKTDISSFGFITSTTSSTLSIVTAQTSLNSANTATTTISSQATTPDAGGTRTEDLPPFAASTSPVTTSMATSSSLNSDELSQRPTRIPRPTRPGVIEPDNQTWTNGAPNTRQTTTRRRPDRTTSSRQTMSTRRPRITTSSSEPFITGLPGLRPSIPLPEFVSSLESALSSLSAERTSTSVRSGTRTRRPPFTPGRPFPTNSTTIRGTGPTGTGLPRPTGVLPTSRTSISSPSTSFSFSPSLPTTISTFTRTPIPTLPSPTAAPPPPQTGNASSRSGSLSPSTIGGITAAGAASLGLLLILAMLLIKRRKQKEDMMRPSYLEALRPPPTSSSDPLIDSHPAFRTHSPPLAPSSPLPPATQVRPSAASTVNPYYNMLFERGLAATTPAVRPAPQAVYSQGQRLPFLMKGLERTRLDGIPEELEEVLDDSEPDFRRTIYDSIGWFHFDSSRESLDGEPF